MKIILAIIFLLITSSPYALELSSATLKQLVTERPDLVADIKAGKNEISSSVSVVKDDKG